VNLTRFDVQMQVLTLLLLMFSAQSFPGIAEGKKEGREGNEHFRAGDYVQAAGAYEQGLTLHMENDREPDRVYYGLQNNLGTALYQQEDYDRALGAFQAAMQSADNAKDSARVFYNAGNTAFERQDADTALEYYQEALLKDPDNTNAKFNYELVKRQQMEEEQQEPEEQEQEQENDEDEQEQQQQENQENNQQEQQNQQEEEQRAQNQPSETEEQQAQEQPLQQQISPEQAERILQALENEEEELLREILKIERPPRRVAKDW